MRKPCLVCGVPTNGSRCPAHEVVREHERSRQERGYDAEYDRGVRGVREAARRAWNAGSAPVCVICGGLIPFVRNVKNVGNVGNARDVPQDRNAGNGQHVRFRGIHPESLTVEHIVPIRDGGTNEPANLGPAHARCNYGWRRSHHARRA